jgi:hypothetical protein
LNRNAETSPRPWCFSPYSHAGQQHEHRRAQVCQGAAGEQAGFGDVDVHRVVDLAMQEEGLTYVVEQHEQDHQATQGVDALQALGKQGGGG